MHTESFHARDPDDRRQHDPRRDEDLELTVAAETKSAVEAWSALMLLRRSPVLVWATMLASAVTFLLTNLGFRILGPQQDLKALDRKIASSDSAMNVRVSRVEQELRIRGDDIRDLRESVRFLTYVVCVQARLADPRGTPPGCAPIIRAQGDAP